jgi:hypothetical protein
MSCDTASRQIEVYCDCGAGLGLENVVFHQIAGTTVTNVSGAMMFTAVTQTAAQLTSGFMLITGYQSGGAKRYDGWVSAASGGTQTTFWGTVGSTTALTTTALTGLRVKFNSNNFDAGTITLYGVN